MRVSMTKRLRRATRRLSESFLVDWAVSNTQLTSPFQSSGEWTDSLKERAGQRIVIRRYGIVNAGFGTVISRS